MPRVSAIVITLNEEANLPRCLDSLRWVDEILVVDSGSTDRTVEVATERGARVFLEEWKGYTAQKNSAIEKARGSWIVSLDADEEFSPEARADLRTLLAEDDPTVQAYAFRRKVLYLGKWITHGDWYPDYVVRAWRRHAGRFEGGHVHESVRVNGAVKYLRSEIFHHSFRDRQDHLARARKYAGLWARNQFEKGRPFIWSDRWFRPPLRFLRAFLLKAGWMDGWRGAWIAWVSAREVFWKYGHLRDLWRKKKGAEAVSGEQ
jgi:glycosyltransferase involved in cell wall biosynthesis